MWFGEEEDEVVRRDGNGDIGKDHRMRTVGNFLLGHMFIMNIAPFLPKPPFGCLKVQPETLPEAEGGWANP